MALVFYPLRASSFSVITITLTFSAVFLGITKVAAAAEVPAGSINRFGQWRAATTAPPPPSTPPPSVHRNGGRRQCPPRRPDPGTNVGYDRFDPNRCVDADVGILAGWRPDLQGARRPGLGPEIPLVEIQTQLGPLTGFRVAVYDRPGLLEEEWPANLQLGVHKEKLNVTVFLGVPYAQPPVEEGRFKVRVRWKTRRR